MTMPPLRPPHRRQALAGLQAAVGSVTPPNPIVLIWRWRYELALAAAITMGVIAAMRIPAPAWVPLGCAAITIAAAALWPSARHRAAARAWCVITPHRVRAGCAGAWIHSRGGRLPAVLRTTCESFGERVYLWCRAGTCAEDFQSAQGLLTAACWAQDIQVRCHPRYRQLVTLDVIRRPAGNPTPPAASTGRMRPAWRPAPTVTAAAHQPAAHTQNGHGQPARHDEAQCRIDHPHGWSATRTDAGILLMYSAPSDRELPLRPPEPYDLRASTRTPETAPPSTESAGGLAVEIVAWK
jgi:hypothetical protein